MAKVPVITSPCPLRWSSMPRTGADYCGKCERRVHNLDGMSEAERTAFFSACNGKVCVAYTVKRTPTIAAISLASIGIAMGASVLAQGVTVNDPPSPYCDPRDLDIIVVGGTSAGKEVQWVDESEAALPDNPDLPTIETSDWLPTPEK